MRLRLALLVLAAVAACTSDKPSEGSSARDVARDLERAGLGCVDAHPGPTEGHVETSTVCSLVSGVELTIDAFANEGDQHQYEANSRDYACEFYPQAPKGSDLSVDLDGFPYLRGEGWVATFEIEGIGRDPHAFDADAYEPLAAATDGEVVRIDC